MSAGTLITILALGWSIALLLAVWWAWGSVRSWWFSRGGKRAGTRYCRACSFDLTGLTRDDTTPAKRCPECGAEIDRIGAVLIGRAVTQWPKLKWAALVVALVTTLFVAALTISRPPVTWMHRMPDWVLVSAAKSGDDEDASAVLRELGQRWGFRGWNMSAWPGTLGREPRYPEDALPLPTAQGYSPVDVAQLARKGLERQADVSRSWIPAWSQVIESAIALGLLNEQEVATYNDNAIVLTATARSRIRRGSRLPVMFCVANVRTPRRVNLFIADGGLVPRPHISRVRHSSTKYGLYPGDRSRVEVDGTETLPAGIHDIEIEADVALGDHEGFADRAKPRRWNAKIEIVEPDKPISQLVADPAVEEAMKRALPGVWIEMGPEMRNTGPASVLPLVPTDLIRVRLVCRVNNPLPMNFALRVEAIDWDRPRDGAVPLGEFTIEPTAELRYDLAWTVNFKELPTALRKPNVQLRFIADLDTADRSPIAGPFWDGKIDFPNVRIYSRGVPGIVDNPGPYLGH